MNLNVEELISFFKEHSNEYINDLKEQDTADAGAAPTGGGGTTTASGKTPKKWESGLARGKANPITVTVWTSGRKYGKTYMNDPKYKWTSDRVMGKTGGSDFA